MKRTRETGGRRFEIALTGGRYATLKRVARVMNSVRWTGENTPASVLDTVVTEATWQLLAFPDSFCEALLARVAARFANEETRERRIAALRSAFRAAGLTGEVVDEDEEEEPAEAQAGNAAS